MRLSTVCTLGTSLRRNIILPPQWPVLRTFEGSVLYGRYVWPGPLAPCGAFCLSSSWHIYILPMKAFEAHRLGGIQSANVLRNVQWLFVVFWHVPKGAATAASTTMRGYIQRPQLEATGRYAWVR